MAQFDLISQNAFKKIFSKQRFMLTFFSLFVFGFLCMICLKLCSTVPEVSPPAVGLLSFFSAFSVICAAAVVIQSLLKQEKECPQKFFWTFRKSWKAIWLSLLVSAPFFVMMLIIGTVMTLSAFLGVLPWVGRFFRSCLIFVPYVSSVLMILLILGAFAALFFCIPSLVVYETVDYMGLIRCFKGNVLTQSIGLAIAFAPLVFCSWLALDSFYLMTNIVSLSEVHSLSCFIETIILIVPVALLLTPALSFFFNFSFEFYLSQHSDEPARE